MSHPKTAPWGIRFAFPQRQSPRAQRLGTVDRILVALAVVALVCVAACAILSAVSQ